MRKGERDEVSQIELVTRCRRKERKRERDKGKREKKRRREGEKEREGGDNLSWTEGVNE